MDTFCKILVFALNHFFFQKDFGWQMKYTIHLLRIQLCIFIASLLNLQLISLVKNLNSPFCSWLASVIFLKNLSLGYFCWYILTTSLPWIPLQLFYVLSKIICCFTHSHLGGRNLIELTTTLQGVGGIISLWITQSLICAKSMS